MDDNTGTDDFQDAFASEMSDAPEEVATPDPIPTKEESANEEAVESTEKEDEPTEEAAEEPVEEPKFATKDDVKAALKEYNTETTGRVSQVTEARDEIIGKLHPEGIDRSIYDTNGDAIKTAQDIVDRGLVNERTGEAYNYDEAASFILEANRQMDANVKELNEWADTVAEQNISLVESNKRVMEDWSDILSTLPKDQVEKLANDYISTQLEFDKSNSYITRMGMSPEAFYGHALSPYRQFNSQMAEKAATEAKEQKEAQTSEQSERNGGIPPQRGASNVKANTGDPMMDALMDELKKG